MRNGATESRPSHFKNIFDKIKIFCYNNNIINKGLDKTSNPFIIKQFLYLLKEKILQWQS